MAVEHLEPRLLLSTSACAATAVSDLGGNNGSGQAAASWAIVPMSQPSSPAVVSTVIGNGSDRSVVDHFQIGFSEPMNIQSMIDNGSIVSAVLLERLPNSGAGQVAQPIPLRPDQFSYDSATDTLTWSLNGTAGGASSLPPGQYGLTLETSRFIDLAGNALQPSTNANLPFGLPSFAAAWDIRSAGANIVTDGYSVPSLADWNSDGLPDLIVGEKTPAGGKIRVYLNTGTAATPAFGSFFYAQSNGGDLVLPAAGCLGCFPRLVDWGTGEAKDLVVGLADGTIRLYHNIGTDSQPVFDAGTNLQAGDDGAKSNINVGARPTPDVVDWNGDGNLDLVVGSLDGKIRVYLNSAGSGESDLAAPITVQDGAGDLLAPTGRSSVDVYDLNGDGRKDLVVGNTEGQLYFYPNVGTDANPVFNGSELLAAGGSTIDLGNSSRSRPFVGDFNGDGIPDILLGSADGMVRLYLGQGSGEFSETFLVLGLTGSAYAQAGAAASFAASPDDPALAYQWDFGDHSAVATGVTASHSYASDGTYSVTLSTTDADGSVIHCATTIMVDSLAPTSSVQALPAHELAGDITVSWSGADNPGGPGLAGYSIYVSDNGGAFTPWLVGTAATSASFTGVTGHTYSFYSVATDRVGNTEAAPAVPDATTTFASTESKTLGRGAASWSFVDFDGTPVTIRYAGTGQAVAERWKDAAGKGDIRNVTITGDNGGGTLTIATRGSAATTTAENITVNGSSLKSINAKTTILLGNITVDGTLGGLALDNAISGTTISIGPRPAGDARTATGLSFDQVAGLTIHSATPIHSLAATQWLTAAGSGGLIDAPSIAQLSVHGDKRRALAGDFEANLTLSGVGVAAGKAALGSVSIAGSLGGSTWDIVGGMGSLAVAGTAGGSQSADALTVDTTGSMGAIALGAADRANFVAGVDPSAAGDAAITWRADALADFANPSASIKSVTIKGLGASRGQSPGRFFADTNFSAAKIGGVRIVNPALNNDQAGLTDTEDDFGFWTKAGTGVGIASVKCGDTTDAGNKAKNWAWKPAQPLPNILDDLHVQPLA